MDPLLYFKNSQVIRNSDFIFTYALGHDLENSIAYATSESTISKINKIPTVSSVITLSDMADKVVESKGVIVSECPQRDFYLLHNFMVKEKYILPLNENRIDETAIIAPSAKIGSHVIIGKNVVIEDYAIIESNTIIGDECEIGPFAILGAKSMQRTIVEGQLIHLEYAGGVSIGSRSRILSGAVIQKPYNAFYTKIGSDTVVSTRVVIGHGSDVGNRVLLSGNSAIAGNCTVGDDVWIGGGAIISDGIKIGDEAKVLIGSVVIKNVAEKETVSGNFAFDHKSNLKAQLKIRQ